MLAFDSLAEAPRPEGLLDVRRHDDRVAIITDQAGRYIQQLSAGGIDHNVVDLSLDEIFEAYVIGRAARLAGSFSECAGVGINHTFLGPRSVMNSLLWKQWRETRGLLAIFIAWMTLAVCHVIGYELGPHYRAPVGHFSGLALIYSFFAAIVLAMRTSHGERTDGTIAFSAALPISMRRMGTVRIVSAVATLAIPIVIAAGILALALASGLVEQAEPRHA